MKRYIFTLLLSFFTLWLMAVPAMRIRRSVTLDDGRTVMVTAYGDEYLDYLLSDEGEVIIEQDGTFHSTGLSATEFLATIPQKPQQARMQVGNVANALVTPWGTKKIPVILAAFKDKKFSVAQTDQKVQSYFDSFFNGTDISVSTDNWGSVSQYFIDQSLGQFKPEFTVIGPIELDKGYGYYIFARTYAPSTTNASGGTICSPHGGRTVVGWVDGHSTSVKAHLAVQRVGATAQLSTTCNNYLSDPFMYGSSKGNANNHMDRE